MIKEDIQVVKLWLDLGLVTRLLFKNFRCWLKKKKSQLSVLFKPFQDNFNGISLGEKLTFSVSMGMPYFYAPIVVERD